MKPPRECINCKKDYWECRKCPVYKSLNTPCDYCGSVGNVKHFIRSTAKGLVLTYACTVCIAKLT
jgi:hypothetical protein